jgi:acyl-CoA reductase-like NAD-dependent aldehyde dehydrogenase
MLDERHDLEELAAEAYRETEEEREHLHRRADAVYAVANRIREELEELEEYAAGLGLTPLLQDVLGAALEAVDVHTLARHLVDDAPGVPHEATPATAGTK